MVRIATSLIVMWYDDATLDCVVKQKIRPANTATVTP